MDDTTLIENCIIGDKKAWDYFVEQFSRLIYDSIRRTFRRFGARIDQDEINDLHNEVFLSLLDSDFHKLRSFEGRNNCSLASFIRTVSVNKTIDYWRRLKPQVSIDEKEEAPESKNKKFFRELMVEDKYESLEAEERDNILKMLLAELSDEEKLLCSLCFDECYEAIDIANQLGISVDNLYVRKQRVLHKLRKIAQDKKVC